MASESCIRPTGVRPTGGGIYRKICILLTTPPGPRPFPPVRRTETEGGPKAEVSTGGGCPLSGYDVESICDSIPLELIEIVSAGGLGSNADRAAAAAAAASAAAVAATAAAVRHAAPAFSARVWTTLLAVETHLSMTESWLVSEEGEEEETCVDRAFAWLDRVEAASADPAEAKRVLRSSSAAAAALVRSWRVNQSRRIEKSRSTYVNLEFQGRSEAQRVAGTMTRSVLLRHETISSFVGATLLPSLGTVHFFFTTKCNISVHPLVPHVRLHLTSVCCAHRP